MITFILVISALIVFHEWGHYYAAKKVGVRVERFSVGFGPVIARIKPKETEFCLSLIPLGGYVKMAGEDPLQSKGEPWEFQSKTAWQRSVIVAAGPILNALLAWVIFSAVLVMGRPIPTTLVGGVVDDMPASIAGIEAGDRILRIGSSEVNTWSDLLESIRDHRDPEMPVLVEKNSGEQKEYLLTPRTVEKKDLFGKPVSGVPMIGVSPSEESIVVRESLGSAIVSGIKEVFILTVMIFQSLWAVCVGLISFKESMAGPVGIYVMTQQAASLGPAVLLDFMGRLSVSLFVLNLLPIPVLDGGHLLIIIIESVLGKKLGDRVKDVLLRIGFFLIIALTFYVLFQDLSRFGFFAKIFEFLKNLTGG